MNSSLREQLGRLGPKRAVDQNLSGSPAIVALRPSSDLGGVRTIPAIQSLHRRGLSVVRAKRAVEAMVDKGLVVIAAPKVENLSALARDLADSGVAVTAIEVGDVDVRRIRERNGLTQEEFALRFGLDIDTLRNWEAGRQAMPIAVRSYLKVIDRIGEQASSALEAAIAQP